MAAPARPTLAAQPSERSALAACVVVLVAVVIAAFWPALSAEFLDYDDDRLYTLERGWRGLSATNVAWMFRSNLMGHYQPLTWLTFGLDHELHGLTGPTHPQAPWYHATSVALHVLCALVFASFARRLLALAWPELDARARLRAAVFAALVWAVHPLRVESVVWLTERRDVLSGLFFVLAACAWLAWAEPGRAHARTRAANGAIGVASIASTALLLGAFDWSAGAALSLASPALLALGLSAWCASIVAVVRGCERERGRAYVLVCACLLLSLLSKAWGIVFPVLLLVLDAWPLRRVARGRGLSLVCEKLPLLVLAVVFARIAHWAQASGIDVMADWREHTLGERVAQACYGLAYYPAKSLWPARLLPIYELPSEMSLGDARWLGPALAVLAITLTALALRRRVPSLLAAWLAFAVIVAPVLGFAQSGPQLVADRYSYIACMPLALLAGGGMAWVASRAPRWTAAAFAIVAVLGVATWRQAAMWRTSVGLWERAYALEPDSPMIATGLGSLRSNQANAEQDPARARVLLEQALALHQHAFEHGGGHLSLRSLSQVRTSLAEVDVEHAHEHRIAALELSRRALELAQSANALTPEHRLDYGTDLVNLGRFDEGLAHLRWYVEQRPERLRGWLNLGGALVMSGRAEEALAALQRAQELEPDDARPWEALARAYEALGRKQDALAAWRRVLMIESQLAR